MYIVCRDAYHILTCSRDGIPGIPSSWHRISCHDLGDLGSREVRNLEIMILEDLQDPGIEVLRWSIYGPFRDPIIWAMFHTPYLVIQLDGHKGHFHGAFSSPLQKGCRNPSKRGHILALRFLQPGPFYPYARARARGRSNRLFADSSPSSLFGTPPKSPESGEKALNRPFWTLSGGVITPY